MAPPPPRRLNAGTDSSKAGRRSASRRRRLNNRRRRAKPTRSARSCANESVTDCQKRTAPLDEMRLREADRVGHLPRAKAAYAGPSAAGTAVSPPAAAIHVQAPGESRYRLLALTVL